MKYYVLLLSTIIPTLSCAMDQAIEISDRHLDTAQRPHITIINKLPRNNPNWPTTRIDISDKTAYSYKPDDSKKTIYSGKGIRFSPNLNKTRDRLGMNDAGDAARIILCIHAIGPFVYKIGKGSELQFGDTLTIDIDPEGGFIRLSKTSNNNSNKRLIL